MDDQLLLLNETCPRDPAIDAWFATRDTVLGSIARPWFQVMRACGDEVREVLHDGCPVACVGIAPFAYVNVFTAHVNVGFFRGAMLRDPAKLLQGAGKRMRHIKLKPGDDQNSASINVLIHAAFAEMKERLENG